MVNSVKTIRVEVGLKKSPEPKHQLFVLPRMPGILSEILLIYFGLVPTRFKVLMLNFE